MRASSFRRTATLAAGLGCLVVTTGVAQRETSPKVGPFSIASQGVLYMGGTYDNAASPTALSGQAYVFYQLPTGERDKRKYPIVMIHGSQQTGANFLGTPDGRPGWAAFFVSNGYPVYVVDQPGRGKSGYFPNAYGPQAGNPSPTTVQRMFTAPELSNPLQWPQAALHTQWPGGPGSGVPGNFAYDQFLSSQVANMPSTVQALTLTTAAVVELLKRIGPAVIVTHSMAGPLSWMIPQAALAAGQKVVAVIAVEPGGPSGLNNVTAPANACGLTPVCLNFTPAVSGAADLGLHSEPPPSPDLRNCWRQAAPYHKLPWLNGTPILMIQGEASYHSTYDYCTSQFLTDAGVEHDFVPLGSVGIHGNGHMMMLEQNNLAIAEFVQKWLGKALRH